MTELRGNFLSKNCFVFLRINWPVFRFFFTHSKEWVIIDPAKNFTRQNPIELTLSGFSTCGGGGGGTMSAESQMFANFGLHQCISRF